MRQLNANASPLPARTSGLCLLFAGALGCGTRADDGAEVSSSGSSGASTVSTGASSDTTARPSTSSDTSAGSPESSSGPSGPETGDTSTSGGVVDCEARNHEFGCAPIDCAAPPIPMDPLSPYAACGGINLFDDDGCMRPWCGFEEQCGPGLKCFWPPDCDPTLEVSPQGCYSPSPVSNCHPSSPLECLCAPLDCSHFGWCIPEEEMTC